MTGGLVIHIEHGSERRTEVFGGGRIRIGFGADDDLRLALPSEVREVEDSPLVEIESTGNQYRLGYVSEHHAARLNRQAWQNEVSTGDENSMGDEKIALNDSDELSFPDLDITLRFHPLSSSQAVVRSPDEWHPVSVTPAPRSPFVAPFIENAAVESAATARRDDAKVFLREFSRELIREISPVTKLMTLLISSLLIGSIVYLGYAMQRNLKQSREQIKDLNAQLGVMKERVEDSGSLLKRIDKTNEDIRTSMSLAPKIVGDYAGGVCLISGTYMFVDRSGKPLRYGSNSTPESLDEDVERDDAGVPLPPADASNGSSISLSANGNGAIAYFDFVGTGFHVGNGYVLTNKHVASTPWTADERAQLIQGATNGRPRMVKLAAYFPKHRAALPMRLRGTSAREDLAVLTIEARDGIDGLPTLPLEAETMPASIGTEVVMMGFPSGPERLLAIMPDDEARTARTRYNKSLETMLNYLSGNEQITPLVTIGRITDLRPRRIVYDARTAEGGSGAPIFGQSGRVIGINFAIFTENNASNLAVPIRLALPILEQAGWQPRDPNGEANTETAADTQGSLTKPTLSATP